MLKIGLTGGIGSGKSTVSNIFEQLGVPVYYADTAAKRIMNEDPALGAQLIEHFGPEVYVDGVLNRSFMASIVFNDKKQLALLNSLVHPATIRDAEAWMKLQDTPYAIKEAALIFESGSQDQLDYVIGVSAPESLRIQRAMKRDNISREAVKERMQNQLSESIKMRLCNFVIVNDEQQLVIPQVIELDKKLRGLENVKLKM
jgi:dephospho-CoA kinase